MGEGAARKCGWVGARRWGRGRVAAEVTQTRAPRRPWGKWRGEEATGPTCPVLREGEQWPEPPLPSSHPHCPLSDLADCGTEKTPRHSRECKILFLEPQLFWRHFR